MSVRRLEHIPGFNIDRVAAAAGDDPEVLRLENLDTDIPPPDAALQATRAAIGQDDANSWLPFTGRDDLKDAVAAYVERRGSPRYDGRREIVITSGEGDAMLDALFCLTDPGDEVILTDPTYAGMLNRVRLVAAVPRLVPLHVADGQWRLDLDALPAAVTQRTRVVFLNNASFEQRMIAWRVGWVVAPGGLASDLSRVQIYNGLVPSGFAQIGTSVALGLPDDHLEAANTEYQRRRDETLRQLDGLPVVRPAGAWSLLLDVAALGLDGVKVSDRLLEQKVAATPMRGWGGAIADRHVRFVFSNEPVDRLALLGPRVHAALEAAGNRT